MVNKAVCRSDAVRGGYARTAATNAVFYKQVKRKLILMEKHAGTQLAQTCESTTVSQAVAPVS